MVNVKKRGFKITTLDNKIFHLRKFFIFFILFLTLDQVSKILVRSFCDPGKSYSIIGNFFRISFVENPGAVFGISIGSNSINKIIFTSVSFIAIGFLIYLFSKSDHPAAKFGFTLILSGAVGNLIDRITFGKVTDFLDFDFPDFLVRRWYTFNIADSCIVVGVIILIIFYTFFENNEKHKNNLS
ncbi:MAG: signal peptidase II [Candidatus Cloacimonadota bacterium]|nr:signal peptidase II [Candidatus Cloacimonadota bacterium]